MKKKTTLSNVTAVKLDSFVFDVLKRSNVTAICLITQINNTSQPTSGCTENNCWIITLPKGGM